MMSNIYLATNFVRIVHGNLPIILTCPHGGEASPGIIPHLALLTPKCCKHKNSQDRHTSIVTRGIAEHIFAQTGRLPYVVEALFHRKFIDANRKRICSLTDPRGIRFYNQYHSSIATFIETIQQKYDGKGFLFDIHGSSLNFMSNYIYLGTKNGETLLPYFDRSEIYAKNGLVRSLEESPRHYTVIPNNEFDRELCKVNGGYTVEKYSNRINCIQIELESMIRDIPQKREFLIQDLSNAIVRFVSNNIVL